MASPDDLTQAEKDTLLEMARYDKLTLDYFFRQATCKQLVARGLAVATRTDVKRPPYRLTGAGKEVVTSLKRMQGAIP